MLSAALVVSDGLGNGFSRGANAAGLADVIVRFDPQSANRVAEHIRALPDIRAFTLRQEAVNVELDAGAHDTSRSAVQVVGPGPRGYAIVAGSDVSRRTNGVVIERGLADDWHLRLGETIVVGDLGPQRILGLAESPDNVAYPLAAARVYVSQDEVVDRFGSQPAVNLAEIWLRDPRNLDEVLVQARATSYGLHGLRFVTRSGVRILLDQAAGIVIDLLVALSLIALVTAAVMLAASARAEVQRRLRSLGVRQALGAGRGYVTRVQALEAALIAVPAATLGVAAGALATYSPTSRLLALLNEPPAGMAVLEPLALAWLAAVAIPAIAAAWPAWRAGGRPAVQLLAGAELATTRATKRPSARAGLAGLGLRLASAKRARLAAATAALAMSCAFVLLMLALASALVALETDPGALGKRYQLVASTSSPLSLSQIRRLQGVQAASVRLEDQAVDSFSLHEAIDVIGYPGDHTVFEAPPLTAGRRLRGRHEAEVGAGLADALGLTPGSTLAIELPSGRELRLRVAGVVGSFEHDGRVAYVPARALRSADPAASEELVITVKPGVNPAAVQGRLGGAAAPAATATARGVPLVSVLRTILRAVAIVDALVCLYALIQTCALTVLERRRSVSVLRALGAGSPAVRRLLAGSLAALVVPSALLGILLERFVLGPLLAHLAANYATLSLSASPAQIAALLGGLLACSALAVLRVAGQATRESVIPGLAAA
jgi:putative ABC transport system permease protein